MPEGDTIHSAARRVGAALVGQQILTIETLHPRFRLDRWPQRLEGRAVRTVEAHGKHLFIRFEGELTIHSHLRMTGAWGVYERGRRWHRARRRAWLVVRTAGHEVVQFDGPVLELMTDSRSRFDPLLAGLGPDVLAAELDERALLTRMREDDQTRALGDALLDQRNVAGLGNIWKSEGCFLAGLDPWRPLARVSDEEALAVPRAVRPHMRQSVEHGGRVETYVPEPEQRHQRREHGAAGAPRSRGRGGRTWVYGRGGLPCRACGTLVRERGQGDDNRNTYWCPRCQR